MPVGRKLNMEPVDVDLSFMQEMFDRFNTRCEAPACADNPEPASSYHQSIWSFAYLCDEHTLEVDSLSGPPLARWDKALAEHMMDRLLARSYMQINMESGGMLDAALDSRDEVLRQIKTTENKQRATEARELRAAIQASAGKIGAPDDELLVARQRQDLRKQMGKPTLGQSSDNRTALLRARLVVPSANLTPSIKEG